MPAHESCTGISGEEHSPDLALSSLVGFFALLDLLFDLLEHRTRHR